MNFRVFIFLLFLSNVAYADILVPYPNKIEFKDGEYIVQRNISLCFPDSCRSEVNDLVEFFESKKIGFCEKEDDAIIHLRIDKNYSKMNESYSLVINKDKINIIASDRAGIFYGIQTLKQLLKKNNEGNYFFPYVEIEDAPRFEWRALLLDEARTFQGKYLVKRLIKEMSLLKMNKLHWHLTDDQGWRIEIKKYPLLTSINSDLTLSEDIEDDQRKGYYSHDDIKEIVKYAKENHVTIIPEIEMPGHASAAIVAYPWLGVHKSPICLPVTSKPVKVSSIYKDVFDISDDRTIQFFKDVLDEICPLFSNGVVHIGGDEVCFSQWKESVSISEFMKENKLISYADLQRWLTNSMSNYLSEKGIRMMGWNDILGDNIHNYSENNNDDYIIGEKLNSQTIIHFWKGDKSLMQNALMGGFDIVNAYHQYTYMDYDTCSISLHKAYSFDPDYFDSSKQVKGKVLGLSCQMWGGSICTIETHFKLFKQIFPRLAAYAEVGWTAKENKNWGRFQNAINQMALEWEYRNIQFK